MAPRAFMYKICLSVSFGHSRYPDQARPRVRWRRRTRRASRLGDNWGGGGKPKTGPIVGDHELNIKIFHHPPASPRNGIEALDLARQHRPDLILMDIQLPEVSGLEVTKWLKDDPELKAIPVVAGTAFAMKGDEERIREGGCEAYLSKPISGGKFIETVRHFLGDA